MALREDVWHSRGYLPHCDHCAYTQLITYRLADSLPASLLHKIDGQKLDDPKRRQLFEMYLDSGYGSCLLGLPENAELVIANWKHFHKRRYLLHAWCVMPNHVHVLIELLGTASVGEIVHSWKSYTGKRLIKPKPFVSAKARVWQPDYFDRFIRDEHHFARACEYVHANPLKAGLVSNEKEWAWSSAGGGIA